MSLVLPSIAFAFGFSAIWLAASVWDDAVRRKRLLRWLGGRAAPTHARPLVDRFVRFLRALGRKKRSESAEDHREAVLLRRAGFRRPDAQTLYRGLRMACMTVSVGFALVAVVPSTGLHLRSAIGIYAFGVAGFFLPKLALNYLARKRQTAIFRELPDVLDILLICVNAGLTFDQGLRRVEAELDMVAPTLAGELRHYLMEVESGIPRRQALGNLAHRNATECLTHVVNVLVQSARYGTDISASLRRLADNLRNQRRMKAEERAATVATKLVFPTILLIMPALMLIVLGPAIIMVVKQISDSL